MTELFLSSTHIPATLLASFIKRLARLSLNASPSAIVMTIPFIYNILKRHPALMVMIHRDPNPGGPFEDPFDPSEPNPINTHALDSSLWEIASHRTHYHTAVSTLARIFEEPFTKPGFAMEDFLDHTYSTLIETDTKRRVKKDPPLSMELELQSKQLPELFPRAAPATEEEEAVRDIVGEFWVFGGS
jgi:U3 small nucleolar RNA-associated protein 19